VPTYQYACTDCADRLEVVQKFTDESLTVCPTCGGKLRKVYSPVGIVFKGSGFYRTDSRASQKSGEPAGASANGSNGSDGKKPDTSSSGDKSAAGDKKSGDTKSGDKVGSSSSSSSSSSSGSSGSSSSSGSSGSSSSGSKVA
jgi:putative FmdB family regulatory protein